MFVKIHPTQLGPPVRTITGVNQPYGIAITSKQQLVVAECGGEKITVRERDGKTIRTVENEKMRYPRGVATGPDGAIYVTDVSTHCLFKFDKDGRLLKTLQFVLFGGPSTIANSCQKSILLFGKLYCSVVREL